jgi:hypothetical protein
MTAELEPRSDEPEQAPDDGRWLLIRDVAVFQLKVLLDAARDVALIPFSLLAAFVDLISGGERPGRLFYELLRLGRASEGWINLFGEADPQAGDDPKPQNVDAMVGRLEALLVEQVDRGGVTASAKTAIDRTLDAFAASRGKDEDSQD